MMIICSWRRPWDTLVCCWDVKQASKQPTVFEDDGTGKNDDDDVDDNVVRSLLWDQTRCDGVGGCLSFAAEDNLIDKNW